MPSCSVDLREERNRNQQHRILCGEGIPCMAYGVAGSGPLLSRVIVVLKAIGNSYCISRDSLSRENRATIM